MDLSHSRDELLTDVVRRGGRIRHRRRRTSALVGALVLALPVLALVSFSQGGKPDVSLTAAGPVDVTTRATLSPASEQPTSSLDPATAVPPTSTAGATPASPPPATVPAPPTTVVGDGVVPTTVLTPTPAPLENQPADGPPARPAPSTTVASGTFAASPPAPTVPTPDPTLAACPPAGVVVSVVTDKPTYAPGETVRGTSTLENRSGTTCLLSTRAFFHIEDTLGRIVGDFAYTADFRAPTKAEPGKTFTDGFTWDQRSCAGGSCVQIPPGTYVAVAAWTEGGPYAGMGSFKVAA
jgi:hypothetical protein